MYPEAMPRRPATAPIRLVVGTVEQHVVRVAYSSTLRLLTVQVDGRTVYRHCGLLPWTSRRAKEIRTPGRELHTLIVEPPKRDGDRTTGIRGYGLWLDGSPLIRVERG
jgi:hypothetical protein